VTSFNLPDDLHTLPILVVKMDSPAWKAVCGKLIGQWRPGQVIGVTDEEFEALKTDVMMIHPRCKPEGG
jgi:hypothetical protein